MTDFEQGQSAAPPPPPAEGTGPGTSPEPVPGSGDDKMMGMLCHLLALSTYVGIPFGNIIGPLVIWLWKKDKSPFVDANGKESLNFQITVTIAGLISGALTCVVVGIFLLAAVVIADIILVIIASIKTNEGVAYRYPWCIRFIK
jgi:uncharacterized Tic20 family protein